MLVVPPSSSKHPTTQAAGLDGCPAFPRIYGERASNLIGLRDLLELVSRLRVALVAVGVVLHRQLAIRGLDVLLRRVTRHAKNLVVVLRAGRHSAHPSTGHSQQGLSRRGSTTKTRETAPEGPSWALHMGC